MHFKSVFLLPAIAIMLLSACNNEEHNTVETQGHQVVVFFSPGGLGDQGYNDQIMRGVQRVHMHYPDASFMFYSPSELDQAKSMYEFMKEISPNVPTLILMASNEFADIAIQMHADMPDHHEILLFECAEQPRFEGLDRIHVFDIDMYGASYLAGVTAAAATQDSVLVWLSNPRDDVIARAASGFTAGYKSVLDREPAVRYFWEDWHGYMMSEQAYEQMASVAPRYGYIFPVAGGTNMGIYRYLRENPDGPLVAGMDVDQSIYSTRVSGSVIKRIDVLLEDLIGGWINGEEIPQHRTCGLNDGYSDWQLADKYMEQFGKIVESHRSEAIDEELKHRQN